MSVTKRMFFSRRACHVRDHTEAPEPVVPSSCCAGSCNATKPAASFQSCSCLMRACRLSSSTTDAEVSAASSLVRASACWRCHRSRSRTISCRERVCLTCGWGLGQARASRKRCGVTAGRADCSLDFLRLPAFDRELGSGPASRSPHRDGARPCLRWPKLLASSISDDEDDSDIEEPRLWRPFCAGSDVSE